MRPTRWLFPGGAADTALSATTAQKSCQRAAREAGITKHVSPHVLRHSDATGLLEAGVDLLTISRLLGHRSFSTTLVYLHVRRRHLESVPSPLGLLPVDQCPRWGEPVAAREPASERRAALEALKQPPGTDGPAAAAAGPGPQPAAAPSPR